MAKKPNYELLTSLRDELNAILGDAPAADTASEDTAKKTTKKSTAPAEDNDIPAVRLMNCFTDGTGIGDSPENRSIRWGRIFQWWPERICASRQKKFIITENFAGFEGDRLCGAVYGVYGAIKAKSDTGF